MKVDELGRTLALYNERAWLYLVADVLTWKDGIGQYLDNPEVQKLAKKLCNEYQQKLYNPILFGTDSELVNKIITIPDGCVATIEDNKIHIKREGKSALEAINEENVDNANKVKPKFHKGEFIKHNKTNLIYKINSVKDYIQQKPTWSEDDEKMFHTIIANLKGFKHDNTSCLASHFDNCITWLKSLKDRYTWK